MSLRGGERVGSAEVLRLSGGGRSRPGSNRGNKEADSVEGRSSKSRSNTSASRGNVSQQASNRDGGDGGGVGVGGQAAPERSSRRSERSTAGTNLERDADGRSTDGRSSGLSMSRKLVSGGRGSIPTGRSREEAQVQQESKSSGAKTPALAEEDKNLIHKRLREKYGFGISDKELRCISRMQAKGQGISYDKGGKLVVPENARGPLFSKAMVIGKETSAVKVGFGHYRWMEYYFCRGS
jgi:hypothetical protein